MSIQNNSSNTEPHISPDIQLFRATMQVNWLECHDRGNHEKRLNALSLAIEWASIAEDLPNLIRLYNRFVYSTEELLLPPLSQQQQENLYKIERAICIKFPTIHTWVNWVNSPHYSILFKHNDFRFTSLYTEKYHNAYQELNRLLNLKSRHRRFTPLIQLTIAMKQIGHAKNISSALRTYNYLIEQSEFFLSYDLVKGPKGVVSAKQRLCDIEKVMKQIFGALFNTPPLKLIPYSPAQWGYKTTTVPI